MSAYYSLDAILAEEERVPVVFMFGCNGLGREIDPSSDSVDLPANASADIPFWMMMDLYKRDILQPRVPKCYNNRMRADLNAEAACAQLRVACPYYYDFGLTLAMLVREAAFAELAVFLSGAFMARYKALLTRAHTNAPEHGGTLDFIRLLTREERHLLDAGRRSMTAFQDWRYTTVDQLQAAPIIKSLKRRRAANEDADSL